MDLEHEPLEDDFEERFDKLYSEAWEMRQRGRYRQALQRVREGRRMAKAEGRVISYLRASHAMMTFAGSTFEPELRRDVALEVISLLESEDRARAFEPDFPEEWYAHTVSWMSACAYDNLAEAVAEMQGYNSAGTHDCINDGLQICRRTGKLECISCFREYAADVYRAADDLEMALHYSRSGLRQPVLDEDNDRRWCCAYEEGKLLLMMGQLEAAAEALERALPLAKTFHCPHTARINTLQQLEVCALLLGDNPDGSELDQQARELLGDLPRGEWMEYDLMRDQLAAIRCCRMDQFRDAAALLTPWDRLCHQKNELATWFEVRLQLIAIYRLAEDWQRVEKLARQLESQARTARDWLSLRRLKRLLDREADVTPWALAAPVSSGPYARNAEPAANAVAETTVPSEPTHAETDESSQDETPAEERTPLHEELFALRDQVMTAREEADQLPGILDRLLAHRPEQVEHPRDATRLLYLLHSIFWGLPFQDPDDPKTSEGLADPIAWGERIWQWGDGLASRFPDQARVLNMAADLGDSILQHPLMGEATDVPDERVERLYQQSLDLDPDAGDNHARAGVYYMSRGNVGEGERALARAFRLDRSDAYAASRLAEVYTQTDRSRDALEVLDMCLREGVETPPLLWEATMAAFRVEAFEAMLTYLQRYEALVPDERWVDYYRATGLLELGRVEEAMEAVEREAEHCGDEDYHLSVLRARGAANLEDHTRCSQLLERVLEYRLGEIDYLTVGGICQLMTRLWGDLEDRDDDDPTRRALEQRMLQMGLMPDEYFDQIRRQKPPEENVSFYRVVFGVTPDEAWQRSPARLPGQPSWDAFVAAWGVLAVDEDKALIEATAWQERCCSCETVTLEVDEDPENTFMDSVGVVWQAIPQPVLPADDEDSFDGDPDEHDLD